jgi:hypothetical protein
MAAFLEADAAIRCASAVHAALRDRAHCAGELLRIVSVSLPASPSRGGDSFGSTVS